MVRSGFVGAVQGAPARDKSLFTLLAMIASYGDGWLTAILGA